jgi:hypothetical protein
LAIRRAGLQDPEARRREDFAQAGVVDVAHVIWRGRLRLRRRVV